MSDLRDTEHQKLCQQQLVRAAPSAVAAVSVAICLTTGAIGAPKNPDLRTDYGQFVHQAQIGSKTRNWIDCGRLAEADIRAQNGVWTPSPEMKALIGKPLPEFASDLQWVNCKPLKLSDLRGHPVFIRFWYFECPMCIASAPLLVELHKDYRPKGLVVIGIHHSKTTRGNTKEEIAAAAKRLGYEFPIAIDNSWNTLDAMWPKTDSRAFSSASFLLDQKGIVVWGHDLGRLQQGSSAANSLQAAIQKVIEKDVASTKGKDTAANNAHQHSH